MKTSKLSLEAFVVREKNVSTNIRLPTNVEKHVNKKKICISGIASFEAFTIHFFGSFTPDKTQSTEKNKYI